jgi:hypothetical protein
MRGLRTAAAANNHMGVTVFTTLECTLYATQAAGSMPCGPGRRRGRQFQSHRATMLLGCS